MTPQVQAQNTFNTRLRWPHEETTFPIGIASHIGCCLCGKFDYNGYTPAAAIVDNQPGDAESCPLCDGTTWVSVHDHYIWRTKGIDAVLQERAAMQSAPGYHPSS